MNQVSQIYLAVLVVLSISTFLCIRNPRCRYAEPLFFFTQFYIFMGVVIFIITWFIQNYIKFE
jgi:hypothetical protein